MNTLTRFKFFVWYFGLFKVPLIGHLKPRLIELNDNDIVVKLALNRRSKNHLLSMYFGALAVGADLAGGLHGFYHIKKAGVKASIAFKSFQAQFIKRPESDVFFICNMGETVKNMIIESQKTGERINKQLDVRAYTHYPEHPEEVAQFVLELSLKVLGDSAK